MTIRIKRAYEACAPSDGFRVVVDKFWPRGLKKEDLKYDEWNKELCPPDELRKFFHQDIQNNWNEFSSRYREWLQSVPAPREFIRNCQAKGIETVTLLYSSKDETRNNALVLKEVLDSIAG